MSLQRIFSLFAYLFFSLSFSESWAATHYVFTASQLQSALSISQTNGEDDTIYLAPQRFTVNDELTYSSTENYSLTIKGLGNPFGSVSRTILDGNYNSRILNIKTYNLTVDTRELVTIEKVTFKNGRSGTGIAAGLLVDCRYDSITIKNCVFENNLTQSRFGGADLVSHYGDIRVDNSVFIHNVAESNHSGGLNIMTIDGEIQVYNNTFANNVADYAAGMRAIIYNPNARVYVVNNIFYENTGEVDIKDLQIDCATPFSPTALHIRHNHFTVDSASSIFIERCTSYVKTNNLFGNPMLDEQYHLLKGSGAIDSGTSTIPYVLSDFEGDPRPQDGNGDGSAQVDMGADEYLYTAFPWALFLPAIQNGLK